MWEIKTDSITGMMKFRLADDDGDIVASFRLNPVDARMLSRLEKTCAQAQEMANNAPDMTSGAEVEVFNDTLETMICDALGLKHDTVFGVLPGAAILPAGDLYAVNVLATVADAMAPEIAKRKANMQQAAEKYTAKYK